ncbi:MAG: hypothetical protein ACE5HX_04690 [bacterium]
MRHWIFILLLSMGFTAHSVFAQWTKSFAVNTSYDDNAFRNYAGLSDYATQISAYLAKDFGEENWQSRWFYRGSFDIFAQYDERNYHYHQVGAAWSRLLNDRENTLNLGINGKLRSNRSAYDYYNFTEAAGYGNFKFKFGYSTAVNLGYKIRSRWYSNIPDLSYIEHDFFVRYTHFFATRTTFMIAGEYGRKQYQEQITEDNLAQWNMDDYGSHRGGMGHMWNGGWFNNINSTSVKPSVGQWLGQIRLAQSLTSSTGLSTDFMLRSNPGDGVRYLAGQVSGYTTEDELFDDPYGYESEEFGATLTQLLPWELTFKAGVESKWKDYDNRPALDLNGETLPSGELREDRQVVTWLRLSKSFNLLEGKSANLIAEFYWMDNQSNDLYYDFQVTLLSLGIATSL